MACKSTSPAAQRLLSQSDSYDYVRFTISDINGIPRGQVVPKRHLESMLNDGGPGLFAGIYAFSNRCEVNLDLPIVQGTNYSNAYLVPEVDMIYDLPWAGGDTFRVGEVLCETRLEDGTPQTMCPRTVARKQLDRLHKAGYDLLSATEVEFVISSDQDKPEPAFNGHDCYSHLLFSEHEQLFFGVDALLFQSGIDVEKMHTEYGPGQVEFSLKPQRGIESFDTLFRIKEAIKEIIKSRGYLATFMTKPYPGANSSGFHFNHSLWDVGTGENALFDPKGENSLSDVGRRWIAGLLKHAPALVAISSPTANCYRRMHHPWSPHKADWGWDCRMASFRVKTSNPTRTYIEDRLPSSASNPYLVAAATVAAGLDGIENDIPCPPVGPQGAKDLPYTLEESLEALQADQVITQALGKDLVDCFVSVKREFEVDRFKHHNFKKDIVSEMERERISYFKFL